MPGRVNTLASGDGGRNASDARVRDKNGVTMATGRPALILLRRYCVGYRAPTPTTAGDPSPTCHTATRRRRAAAGRRRRLTHRRSFGREHGGIEYGGFPVKPVV